MHNCLYIVVGSVHICVACDACVVCSRRACVMHAWTLNTAHARLHIACAVCIWIYGVFGFEAIAHANTRQAAVQGTRMTVEEVEEERYMDTLCHISTVCAFFKRDETATTTTTTTKSE